MDINYLLLLQKIREITGGIFDTFFLKATLCGESIITFLLLAGIYWCISKRTGQYMFFNIAFATSLNQTLKNVFRIERPWIRDARVVAVEQAVLGASGYSMPSGHTTRAVATWGAAGTECWNSGGNQKNKKEGSHKVFAALLWGIALLVMFSRNYLGVHTPQDVAAALLLGILLLWLTRKVLQWVEKKVITENRDIMVLVIGVLLLFLPMLRYGCLSNIGAGFGFLLGWVLERRLVNFEVKTGKLEKGIRFVIGGAVIVIVLTSLPAILTVWMPSRYAGFFTMFTVAIFISVVYPFLFSTVGNFSKYRKLVLGTMIMLSIGLLGTTIYKIHCQKEAVALQETAAVDNASTETQELVAENNNDATENVETTNVKIIAHRGYSAAYPENTLAAFAGAVDIGADMIELDVQETKDGVIVVFHDEDLVRVAGKEGTIADYTYDELSSMEVGSWFSEEFAGEKIPMLAEVMEFMKDTKLNIYLELKDIGEVEGFEESVLQVVDEYGMRDRCIFASFQYQYLQTYEDIDASINTLLNTTSELTDLAETFPADYYGLYASVITREQVEDIHKAGRHAYVWTVSEPADMKRVIDLGVEGIVTNYPGRAKVAIKEEYNFLAEHYLNSVNLPGLYVEESKLADKYNINVTDMVVQGLTKVSDELVISAYSKSGEQNSILYCMSSDGVLRKIVDLGFKAHVGGLSYDVQHDLLWITGPEGNVYALAWNEIANATDNKAGNIVTTLAVGLLNHNESKVASFLTTYENRLYVGSYVDGNVGQLREYNIEEPGQPIFIREMTIPQRIQGMTFKKVNNKVVMLLSQGYQTEDSALLVYDYAENNDNYKEPKASYNLPEGAEQIQTTDEGMYILFESAVRPYRETARLVNDQVYFVDLKFLQE